MLRLFVFLLAALAASSASEPVNLPDAPVASLDGTWQLATDPQNVGRDQRWFEAPRPEAKPVRVPWIIQDTFPAYHGAAWYWLRFVPAANPHPGGRSLLRFTSVDFSGEVWLNNQFVGKHEGAETPFTLDVTNALRPGATNLLAVRVMNPDNAPTDGLAFRQTPRGAREVPHRPGGSYNAGGITGSVDLLSVPAVRIDDLAVFPDPKTGRIAIEATVTNALETEVPAAAVIRVSPAAAGQTLAETREEKPLPPGRSVVKAEIRVPQPRLWNLNDPFLYRVSVSIESPEAKSRSDAAVRCGFRDFRVENGSFRLNGRRLFVRSTHTTSAYPIGQSRPHDPDLARRDLINLKMMGFNMIRFIWGGSEQYLLDLCDEIGLLVYQETLASQPMEDSPRLAELFDASVAEVIRRDRNHPSVVLWGLLNEAQLPKHEAAFRHATGMLPLIRSLDPTRLVVLNSGRFDNLTVEKLGPAARRDLWQAPDRDTPWVACQTGNTAAEPATSVKDFNPTNPGATPQTAAALPPGQVILQPGEGGERSVVRWTAPTAGTADLSVRFRALSAKPGAAQVSVTQNGRPVYAKSLSSTGYPTASHTSRLTVAAGDHIDFTVGGIAATALQAEIVLAGKTYDVQKDYSRSANPSGAWSYGSLGKAGDDALVLFTGQGRNGAIGSVANPGSTEWQDIVTDDHTYPRVPHTAAIYDLLRKKSGQSPVFLSEYGVGSAVDLWRVTRQFERLGKAESEEGQYYAERLRRYLGDWERWKLAELYARPEDFFQESLRKMAGQRTLGINAIRANPNIIGYSLTSGIGDPVNCGEGLTTVFRELKPGAVDAIFEAFAPLRWCLFVEPVNIYRGTEIRLEAVLANEDALPPGEYPARFQVVGPANERIWEKKTQVTVPGPVGGAPLAFPVLGETVRVDGPAGTYRFLATLESGGAPTGGEVRFFVDDPAKMPRIESEVVLFGGDPILAKWLAEKGVRVRPFTRGPLRSREVILVGPSAPPDADAWVELARHVAQGSTAVFLDPAVFQKNGSPVGWLPLANKGRFEEIKSWLYLKDEWAKRHPIFDGLPSGGLMDPVFYREIIPDTAWIGLDAPAEAVAGAIKASEDYSSGLMVAVYPFGSGRFILSNLLIRENLGRHPAAERLLRNLIRHASTGAANPVTALPATFEAQLKAIGYR